MIMKPHGKIETTLTSKRMDPAEVPWQLEGTGVPSRLLRTIIMEDTNEGDTEYEAAVVWSKRPAPEHFLVAARCHGHDRAL